MRLGTPPVHRNVKIALLMVAAAALTMLLSQCRMVTDAVAPGSAVREAITESRKPTDCVNACRDAYNQAKDAETALHKANELACNGDLACLDAEEARHEAVMNQINQDRKVCVDGCHHQGGGTGGR